MRLMIFCMECVNAEIASGRRPADDLVLNGAATFAELNDQGFLESTCKSGHSVATVLHVHHFQLLFDLGLLAFKDGYHRESVTSFAASLERFFEFTVKVIARKHGLPDDVLTDVWKDLARQSERQLGAYLVLFAVSLGREAPSLGKKMVELRNNVTHKGSIPSAAEAAAYGDDVLRVMREALGALSRDHRDQIRAQMHSSILPAAKRAESAGSPVVLAAPMAIDLLAVNGPLVPTFKDALDGLETRRPWYRP
jgi:hypothetical protein